MARRAGAFLAGVALGLVLGTAVMVSRADEASADNTVLVDAAREANVDPLDLTGAANTTGLQARVYLVLVGELAPPAPPPAPPPSVVVQQQPPLSPSVVPLGYAAQVACIESKESGGANVWNRQGSGAGGVLQYFPSTFARGAVELGHPEWSLWNPAEARAVAAHDLALGRRAQWTVAGCGR